MSLFTDAEQNLEVTVRKWVVQIEDINADGDYAAETPSRHVVVGAILINPYAGRFSPELDLLADAGHVLGRVFTQRAVELLDGDLASYGKAGIVGENGELEHIAALLHPRFGAPTREVSGGVSILPSAKKRGGQGATIDIPLHHKKAMMIRTHFDAVEFRVGDAPRANEIVVALAASNGPRLHARVGGLTEEQATGNDGLR
ncbi:MAG: hypothetical protein JWP75_889 [Frondihabitans sp.]|nr:hypothetical protein [Frondihabitans sp.]